MIARSAVGDRGLHDLPPTWMLLRTSPLLRHAQDRAERLAVEQEDALVALAHRRQELLHHRQAPAVARGQLDDRVDVQVALGQRHHALAARAVERLDHRAPADLVHEAP